MLRQSLEVGSASGELEFTNPIDVNLGGLPLAHSPAEEDPDLISGDAGEGRGDVQREEGSSGVHRVRSLEDCKFHSKLR